MSLPMTVQLRELSFTLGLGDTFSITRLNEVFKAHSDKDLVLLDDDYHTMRYRYLRGEIDLVYECDRRFLSLIINQIIWVARLMSIMITPWLQ